MIDVKRATEAGKSGTGTDGDEMQGKERYIDRLYTF
jgi:hypothetical protein